MTEYLLNDPSRAVGLLPVKQPDYPAGARVIRVGADKAYRSVGAAVSAARDGDVILVDAGTYTNDFSRIAAKLTIIGVGGMVNMVATVPPPDKKAIMTVGDDLRLENFTFIGAKISAADGGNAAGIRYEGGNLVLVNDAFLSNQNGLMGGAGTSGTAGTITIDHSLFSGNGSGTGNTHNIYVGAVGTLTVTNSVFENAVVGHELKSRALENTITDNLFRDGPTGTASYSIDLPNGGKDTVTGNVIEKGPKSQNAAIVHFGGEGTAYDGSFLLMTGNTFINDASVATVALLNHTGIAATMTDNTLVKIAAAKVVSGPAVLDGNVDGAGVPLASGTVAASTAGILTFNDSAAHTVTLNGNPRSVQGGAGRLTVLATAGRLSAAGGSGGMDFTDSPDIGASYVSTKTGSTNTLNLTGYDTVDSRGTDTINIAAGNGSTTIRGAATVRDGDGNDFFTVLGTATITKTGGSPVISVGAAGRVTLGGTLPFLTLSTAGGRADVDVMEGSNRVQFSVSGGGTWTQSYDGALTMTTASTGTGATIRLGEGKSLITSVGNDVIWAGAGKADVIIKGHAEVHAGTGELTIWGRASTGSTVYGNGGTYTIDGNGGNITYYGGDKASTVNAQLSNVTLVGGSARLTIAGAAGWQRIIGGAGGVTYDGTGGSANVTTAAGSANSVILGVGSVDSWGRDTITTTGANTTLTVHGDSTVTSGGGTNHITLMGRDTVYGRGVDWITATAGSDVTLTAGADMHVTEKAANVVLKSSAGTATVLGGSAGVSWNDAQGFGVATDAGVSTNVTVTGGKANIIARGADQLHLGSGASTINTSGGGTEIWGGSGAMTIANANFVKTDTLVVHGGSGAVSINPGGNQLTFIGGAGSALIASQYGSLYIQGGSGAITASGGNLGTTFVAGSGNATLGMTSAGGEVTFGSGNTTVTVAGGKATVFDFIAGSGGGTDIIKGFRVGIDKLVLQGVGVQSQGVSGGAANLLLTDGTHVQLMGLTSTAKLFA